MSGLVAAAVELDDAIDEQMAGLMHARRLTTIGSVLARGPVFDSRFDPARSDDLAADRGDDRRQCDGSPVGI